MLPKKAYADNDLLEHVESGDGLAVEAAEVLRGAVQQPVALCAR